MLSLIGQNIVTDMTSIISKIIHLYYLYSIVYLRHYSILVQKLCAKSLILQI